MATVTQTRKSIPTIFYPLLLLTLVAVGLSIYRLVVGLGATTNMSDHYPWGLWVTVDLFLIPVAGAAFTISLISYFFGREKYHSVIRPAVLAGFIGYAVVGILLFLDIGRWHQFYNIMVPEYINLHSFLEEISICITLYSLILLIEVAPIFLERWNINAPIRWINRGIFIIAGAGIVLSTLHQSSLGSLFLIMPYKLHPLWWTPALPVLFFIQAIATGLGMTAIAISLIWKTLKISNDRQLFYRIGQAMSLMLGLYIAVKWGDWLGAGEVRLLLEASPFAFLAWLELIIGIYIPLFILVSKFGTHSEGPFWAGVFVLMGTFINRLIVSWIGLAEPTPVTYTPSLIEVLITIGMIAGGFLAYGAVVRFFKLFPERGEAHG